MSRRRRRTESWLESLGYVGKVAALFLIGLGIVVVFWILFINPIFN